MIYEKIVKESQKLDKQICAIQSELNTLPEGKLICASNGKGYKWYQSDGHKSTPQAPFKRIKKGIAAQSPLSTLNQFYSFK